MPFSYKEYLTLAENLKDSADEASRRTAVSRGYYAAYHKSKIVLGYTSSQFARHEDVVNSLRSSTEIDNCLFLSSQLDNLKLDRVKADYKFHEKVDSHFLIMFWTRLQRYIKGLDESA